MIQNPEWFVVLFVFYHGSESEWVWAKSAALFVLELFRTTGFYFCKCEVCGLVKSNWTKPWNLEVPRRSFAKVKEFWTWDQVSLWSVLVGGSFGLYPCILVCFVVWSRHSINCNRSKNPIGQPWWCQWWCCAWNHSDECCCCTTRRSLV